MTKTKLSMICTLLLWPFASMGEQVVESIEASSFEHFIEHVDYSGTGCPNGSMNYDSASQENLRLTYYNFDVDTNGGQDYRYCNVSLELNIPYGWQVGLEEVEMLGGCLRK